MAAAAAASSAKTLTLFKALAAVGRSFSSDASGSVQTALIKQLRERTGAPIKDVKALLMQCGWDSEAAFTELRRKGLAAANKKASRVAAEGLISVALNQKCAAIVEINSETDFVARNDLFQKLAISIAKSALAAEVFVGAPCQPDVINLQSLEALRVDLEHPKLQGEVSVHDAVAEVAAITGENVKLRRAFCMSTATGLVSSYLHTSPFPGLARIAGLLTLEVEGGCPEEQSLILKETGSNLAMHLVAARPLFLSKDHVTSEALNLERDILKSQALTTGKPQSVVDKMVEGRLRKYVEEIAFLEQKFVVDDSKTVKGILDAVSKNLQKTVTIGKFFRMEVGEGIESCGESSYCREHKDFAAEVAAQAS
ncbi:hypothetical protein O6H91_22G067000 [Diphasiastrum complanatum]|uniref:Uncharacterized protein n=1 Tax=Diphasiastrum complanatum TaxID=34168 RepID=A0ACC2AGW8_DIPCM|nr:hypothetical protein O6H91_22G067000 [Diphasiastrum complanatum]